MEFSHVMIHQLKKELNVWNQGQAPPISKWLGETLEVPGKK